MDDVNKRNEAQRMFERLCGVLDAREWKYERNDEELRVDFGVQGEDLIMPMRLTVEAETQLVRLMSPLPFQVPEERRLDIVLAVTAINCNLMSGNFDFDFENGILGFRIANCYIESDISEAALDGMLYTACDTIDRNNDQLKAIVDGTLSLEQFLVARM